MKRISFLMVFLTWNLSALWVFLSYVAGMVAVTSKYSSELSVTDFVFAVLVLVWLSGFIIEVVADNQRKSLKKILIIKINSYHMACGLGQDIQTILGKYFFGLVLLLLLFQFLKIGII